MAEPATRQPFAHLHVHTEYSMLDGAARLKELFKEVERQGMTHVAMTDHGNMYGAAEFHRQAKDAGITPVIGIEAYVAPEARGNTTRGLWPAARHRSSRVREAVTQRPSQDLAAGDSSMPPTTVTASAKVETLRPGL